MKKLALAISILTILFSCRATKHVASDLQASVSEQKDISIRVFEHKLDSSLIVINEDENTVIFLFSLPDSTGKQYIVSKTEIQRNKTATNKKNIVTNTETAQEDKSNIQTLIKSKTIEDKKTETKDVWWFVCFISTVIFGMAWVYIILLKIKKWHQFRK